VGGRTAFLGFVWEKAGDNHKGTEKKGSSTSRKGGKQSKNDESSSHRLLFLFERGDIGIIHHQGRRKGEGSHGKLYNICVMPVDDMKSMRSISSGGGEGQHLIQAYRS